MRRYATASPAAKRWKNWKSDLRKSVRAGRITDAERQRRLAEARRQNMRRGIPPSGCWDRKCLRARKGKCRCDCEGSGHGAGI